MKEEDFKKYEECNIVIERVKNQKINIGFAGVSENLQLLLRRFDNDFKDLQNNIISKIIKLQEDI